MCYTKRLLIAGLETHTAVGRVTGIHKPFIFHRSGNSFDTMLPYSVVIWVFKVGFSGRTTILWVEVNPLLHPAANAGAMQHPMVLF